MLIDPSKEKLLEKAECSYELAVLVAQRARALVDGAQPLVPDKAANAVSLACQEIVQGKVVGVKGDHKEEVVIPLTRERREADALALRKKEEAEQARLDKQLASVAEEILKQNPEDEEDIPKSIDSLFEEISSDEFYDAEDIAADEADEENIEDEAEELDEDVAIEDEEEGE